MLSRILYPKNPTCIVLLFSLIALGLFALTTAVATALHLMVGGLFIGLVLTIVAIPLLQTQQAVFVA